MLDEKLKECINAIDRLETQSKSSLYLQPDETGDGSMNQNPFKNSKESQMKHLPDHLHSCAITEDREAPSNIIASNESCLENVNQDINASHSNMDGYISPESIHDKARALYLRGRALNVTSSHDPESERLLSKSVKLEPSFVEAWNELGESYWKREDVDNARICFEGALSHRENKTSLRKLSIVLRQKSSSLSAEERLRAIEAGLTKARESVQLDTSDGISWSILGNAYLAHFFSVSQNPRTLRQAMSAYRQAEKDVIAKSSPELHYNKAIALKYEEDYSGSLEGFAKAYALDPSWKSAKEQEESLMKSLIDIQNLIECKGKLKNKKFNMLVNNLGPLATSTDSSPPNKHLGPFVNSLIASKQGKGSKGYTQIDFTDLLEDTCTSSSGDSNVLKSNNEGSVILGKVICSVHSEQSVPFTFCMTDRNGYCVAVNLYNLAPGKGVIIGDSVAIAEPSFRKIDIKHKSQVTSIPYIILARYSSCA